MSESVTLPSRIHVGHVRVGDLAVQDRAQLVVVLGEVGHRLGQRLGRLGLEVGGFRPTAGGPCRAGEGGEDDRGGQDQIFHVRNSRFIDALPACPEPGPT